MFQQNSNQSAEGQTKKGTLSDMKEQQRQKPPGGKTQDWVSRFLQQLCGPHFIWAF
jgi:hypothetical protein